MPLGEVTAELVGGALGAARRQVLENRYPQRPGAQLRRSLRVMSG